MLTDGKYEDIAEISGEEVSERRYRSYRARAYVFAFLGLLVLPMYAFVERDGASLFTAVFLAILAVVHFVIGNSEPRKRIE